mgnify:CR=1 FL=1
MKNSLLSVTLLFCSIDGFGQAADTLKTYTLQSATIIAYQEKPVRKTSLNLSILKIESLSRYGNYNLTDLMARTPGVSMLSTGVAISKPVIRGLYGNRVLVLLSGH